MTREKSPLIQRGALALSLVLASHALAACGSDSVPDEVAELRAPERVEQAREDIQATQLEILGEDGLLGFHALQLVRPIREETTATQASGEFEGSSSGLFILVAGGTSGEIEGQYQSETSTTVRRFVRLAWQVNNDTQDTIVSDFPVDSIVVRDATEESGVALEFALNIDSLIDYEGTLDRSECVINAEVRDSLGHYDDKAFLVPAQEGCMQATDYIYPDDYIRSTEGLIERVYLYLDEAARNQYFTAIGDI